MNDTSIEARLERTLHEVADRLPERNVAPPEPVTDPDPHSRGKRVLAAAAVVVMAMSIGGYVLTRDEDNGVLVGTEVPRPLLTADVDGYELRLETAGEDCVVVVLPGRPPSFEPACAGSDAIAIKATNWGGSTRVSTLVWGIANPGMRFTSAIKDVATSTLYEERVGSGAAFLLVIDARAASGTIDVLDGSSRVIGHGSFDHGGPARRPKGALGDQEIAFAYRRDGAIWLRTTEREEIRITDGTEKASDGYPLVLPDGYTVVHSYAKFDSPIDGVRATDARDGSSREVPTLSMLAVSPDGRVLATSVINDDSGATEEIVFLRTDTFAEIRRIRIGVADTAGSVWDAVWDADGQGLLVKMRCCWAEANKAEEDHLWFVDVNDGSAAKLPQVDDGGWILASRAAGQGQFPALRHSGSELEWGTLRLDGTNISFEPVATLSADVGLDIDGNLYLSARRDGLWLVGDGDRLFELNASGHLKLLLDDVDSASAP